MTKEGYRWARPARVPSERQKAILEALVRGKSNAEIGEELGISSDGVKWHVSELLSETGLSDRQSLARWWHGGPLVMSLDGSLREGTCDATSVACAAGRFVRLTGGLDYGLSMAAMAGPLRLDADGRGLGWRVLRIKSRE